MSICLDAWAVLAWLDGDEPAAGQVQRAFETERPWMSWLTIGEVAHLLERRHGLVESELVVGRIRAAVALGEVTPSRVLAAAHIKAAHPIPLAGCFAIATATARAATLFTGDPEVLERDFGCAVLDLRPAVT